MPALRSPWRAATIGLSLVVLAGCATQQDLYPLYDRINALEKQNVQNDRKLTQLRQQLELFTQSRAQDDQDLRTRSASIGATLDTLRDEVRALGGRLDESEHRMRQELQGQGASDDSKRNERLERLEEVNRLNSEQIARMQQYLNLEPSGKKGAGPGGPQAAPAKEPSEDELYTRAKQALDENRLQEALEGFQAYMKKYPRAASADNAQFWIGEIYYRDKWYEKAILEYQKVVENFPKGNKVAAAMLKQGMSFYNLKDDSNARLILKELISKYPNSSEADIARKQLK
jgi:tol-pal system protein YbgF